MPLNIETKNPGKGMNPLILPAIGSMVPLLFFYKDDFWSGSASNGNDEVLHTRSPELVLHHQMQFKDMPFLKRGYYLTIGNTFGIF